jgi:hypothetical protein
MFFFFFSNYIAIFYLANYYFSFQKQLKVIPPELRRKVVYKPTLVPDNDPSFFEDLFYSHRVVQLFNESNIDFHIIPYYYGGAKALAQYKAVIDIPYQFSTMKFYENLSHGVLTLIPTIKLWKQLIQVHLNLFSTTYREKKKN